MLHGPGAAKVLADQIEAAAGRVSERLCNKTYNARKTGVTSDDVSQAMMPFLEEVEELRQLPESTAIAFDLVMTLGEYSYGELDGGASGYGERPSDIEVDDLLVDLATERKQIDPSWNFAHGLETLRERAEELSRFGIEDFCTQTIELLSAWPKDVPAKDEFTQGQ